MKLESLYDSLLADMQAVVSHYKVDMSTVDHGNTGLKAMWSILHEVSANRAYDDTHPRWQRLSRVLPYDGRDACFYYVDGSNDSHVATLLKRIKTSLTQNPV